MSSALRFVVFDQETTGLEPSRDRIISIGAIGVQDGEIALDDIFEALIRVSELTSAVVVHGITPEQARRGVPEEEAVAAFLDYIGPAILVGHHVGFDRAILRVAAARLGRGLPNPALDTMRMALALAEAGALQLNPAEGFALDVLCRHFGLVPHDRHTAPGDAFLTAQVFVRLLRACHRHGLDVRSLCEKSPP